MALTGLGGGNLATGFCRAGLHSRRGSWPCAVERGAGVLPSAVLGAQKNGGRMGERLGRGGELGFALSLLTTGGAFAFL